MSERRAVRPHALGVLPLIGRDAERATLTRVLDDAERGTSSTIFLAGEGGIGKTRLAESVLQEATARGWSTAVGRAYPVETGVPYAVFADALLPLLKVLDRGALAVLSRGGEAELARLFPALELRSDARTPPAGATSDIKARLLWNFSQFLGRFAAKRPLLIALENLQWADASSLELLHFTARQRLAAGLSAVAAFENLLDRSVIAGLTPTPLLGDPRIWRVGLRWQR